MNTARFNAQELCSRKLWQLVNTPTNEEISTNELTEAIAELSRRRHYLEKMQETDKLEGQYKG